MVEQGCPACVTLRVSYVKVHITRPRVAVLVDFHPQKNKSQNESKNVDTTRWVFNSNLQPQRVSAHFLIISYLILAEKRSGSIWSCDIVAVGSGIVSWPSVHSELHAPRSLSSIYSLEHPPNYRLEGIVADTFHLCSSSWLHKARLSCKTTPWILDKPSGLYRLFSRMLCLLPLTNARTTAVWHMTVFQIVHSSDADGKHFNPSNRISVWMALLLSPSNLIFLYKGGWGREKKTMYVITSNGPEWHWWKYGLLVGMMSICYCQCRNCTVVCWV